MRQFVINWVKALRSGDYEQGTHTLELVEEGGASKYCCLGVLLYETSMPYQPQREGINSGLIHGDVSLPDKAVHKFGIDDCGNFWVKNGTDKCPHYDRIFHASEESSSTTALSTLNDVMGMTFDEIADVIEWVEQNNNWV